MVTQNKVNPATGKRKLPFDDPEPRKKVNDGSTDHTDAVKTAKAEPAKAVGIRDGEALNRSNE